MPNLKWNTVSQILENDWPRKAANPFKIYENLILRVSFFSFTIYQKVLTIGHVHFTWNWWVWYGANHFQDERQRMSSNTWREIEFTKQMSLIFTGVLSGNLSFVGTVPHNVPSSAWHAYGNCKLPPLYTERERGQSSKITTTLCVIHVTSMAASAFMYKLLQQRETWLLPSLIVHYSLPNLMFTGAHWRGQ